MSRGILFLALLLLALPYLLLTRQIASFSLPEGSELLWALKNSLLQGLGSSIVALFAAIPLMLGLWQVQERFKGLLSWLLLLPSLLPPLFVLLSFLTWVDPFPVGLIGVVLVQGFLNAGLAAVLLARIFETKLQGLSEAALVLGSSRFLFFRRSLRLVFLDLVSVGVAIFSFCFANFSIPLVIGGGRATNIEVLIYEKIRVSSQMGEALGLGLIQLAIMALFLFLPRSQVRLEAHRAERLHVLKSRWGLAGCALYVLLFWFPLVRNLPEAYLAIDQIDGLWEQLLELMVPSVLISLATGLLCLVLFLLFSLGFPRNHITRIARAWLAPSTVLLGFAFLGIGDQYPLITYAVVLAFLFFLPLFRLGLDRKLESIEGQILTAQTLGASDFLIWRRVIRPQIWQVACVLAGISSLWAFGEFAMGRVLLSQNLNWALLSESLMSSYRIEAGLGVGFLILFSGGLLFTFFWRLGDVGR